MNTLNRLKQACRVPIEVCRMVAYKLSHHKGRFSYFKTAIFTSALIYLLMQPLNIIRSAFASCFMGYVINNFSNSVLDSAVEVVD